MEARLEILETVYRFDLDEAAHMRLIQQAASAFWQKQNPVIILRTDFARHDEFTCTVSEPARDWPSNYAASAREAWLRMPAALVRRFTSLPPAYCGSVELASLHGIDMTSAMNEAKRWGIDDTLGMAGGTCEGGFVGLLGFHSAAVATAARERDHWRPLAAHLAAAWRLRSRLEAGAALDDLADARFRPDGRCLGESRRCARGAVDERLRHLVRERERARSPHATRANLWSDLIHGRWSLVDHFESGGKRVVLALRNQPIGSELCRLTANEAAALEQARKGASNKEIGLNLGMSPSLVTRLLQRAARKLNATLAEILYFASADTMKCRRLLFGGSHMVALSCDTASEWRRALSGAEKHVVAAVLRGYTNREIAAMRGRSIRTIVNQLASAFEKLGVRSRRELLSRLTGLEHIVDESPVSKDETRGLPA